jgi:hypothetical protein
MIYVVRGYKKVISYDIRLYDIRKEQIKADYDNIAYKIN